MASCARSGEMAGSVGLKRWEQALQMSGVCRRMGGGTERSRSFSEIYFRIDRAAR